MVDEVYLDNAAAVQPDAEVLDFFREKLQECYANQEALHSFAYRERQLLAAAEKELSQIFTGTDDFRVIWGGSATEIFHLLSGVPFFRSALLSELEHPALLANFRDRKKSVLWHAESSGLLRSSELDFIPDTVCLHQVQSELGVIQDLKELFSAVPESCCRLVDAVQAAGKVPLYTQADIIVISGVKFGSPGGAAALLNPRSRFTEKLLDFSRRARSETYSCGRISVPLVLTLVHAASRAESSREKHFKRLLKLRSYLAEACAALGLTPTLPETTPVSPYILNMLLPYQQSAVVVRALSESGIYVAPGSACSAESSTPSAALLAIGKSRDAAYRALRVSFSAATGSEDVEIFLSGLKQVLKNY